MKIINYIGYCYIGQIASSVWETKMLTPPFHPAKLEDGPVVGLWISNFTRSYSESTDV